MPVDSPALLSDLIGLIYDAASDLSLWPRLLEGMADYLAGTAAETPSLPADTQALVAGWFEGRGMPALASVNEAERSLFATLAPHFLRGHQIHQQLAESEDERNLLEGVMDRLPLGMAIVDGSGTAISLNRPMLSLARSGSHLRLEAGRLMSRPAEALAGALARIIAGTSLDEPLRRGGSAAEGGLSLWVSRLATPTAAGVSGGRAVVLAASPSSRALSETALAALFDLTPAEARLTQQLVLGRTVDEAALAQGISLNTAKTQLKKVFAKVGVRRQSELIQAVYASPLWLDLGASGRAAIQPPTPSSADLTSGTEGNGGMSLPDGRWLAWSDCGDPQGVPVIFMHGMAGSRYLRHPDDSLLVEQGLRLIIPERPGSGDSAPRPGRKIADWPADVAALADHLGLPRFAVMGYSAGTPYAFAVARAMPERVLALSIVAAMLPVKALGELGDYAPVFRMSILLTRYAPSLVAPMVRVMVKGIRNNVYRYIEQTLAESTAADKQVFADPRMRASYAAGLLAGVKRGEQDLALELLLASHDWSLDDTLPDLPLQFWHGDGDPLVSIKDARRLAARFPAAPFHSVPGAGHYVLYSHWREILAGLRGVVDGA